jgi:hypothetical protein
MRDLHIGRVRPGARLHLTTITVYGTGFSECGRRDMREVWPITDRRVSVDDPWCGLCLGRVVGDAVRWLERQEGGA